MFGLGRMPAPQVPPMPALRCRLAMQIKGK
jgi:hypothetical protein